MNERIIGAMRIETVIPPAELRAGVCMPRLVHGAEIAEVNTGDENLEGFDGLITANRSLSLGIKTADCAPICFSDGTTIGIAHIGWRGLCAGLVEKMLERFNADQLSMYVGPFLHSFEIQRDSCYDQITAKFGEQFITEGSGKIIFNFKGAIDSLVPPGAVYDERDTAADRSLPSYRRDKTRERFCTVVSFV